MSQELQFERLADKAHRSYHQDGLLDVFVGWIIVGLAVGEATHWRGPLTILFVLSGFLVIPIRKRIVIPRLGYVKFFPQRNEELLLRVAYPLSWILGISALLIMYTPQASWEPGSWISAQRWLQPNWTVFIGSLVSAGLGLLGWGIRIRRFYLYGLLSLSLMIGCQFLGLATHIEFSLLGGAMVGAGLVLLFFFLRKYPAMIEGSDNRAAH